MNHRTTTRGLAGAALLGLLVATSACGTETGVATTPAQVPGMQHGRHDLGQLSGPEQAQPSPAPAGKRVPDLLP
ncbi:hypothetical protein [Nocardioides taihuensis]|uniref:Uncharacterized protein n=1 Tax=Nocardioides taihuensis TaxID=1835606 RepID=A0ABW0BQ89_9ACTN